MFNGWKITNILDVDRMLQGYGNAIMPALAAEFILAVMEVVAYEQGGGAGDSSSGAGAGAAGSGTLFDSLRALPGGAGFVSGLQFVPVLPA